MKKNNLTSGAFAVLLLASTVAGADQQYPAADFQPEVLYQDSDYIAKNSSKTTATKSAAAAPKAAAASSSVESAHDSKYPAADFQPEVLYQDPNYKHIESVKASASKKEAVSASVSVSNESISPTEAAESTQESSFTSYLIGLIVLALAGFYFFKIRSTTTTEQKKTSTQQPVKASYALTTGVAKYLNRVSGTGVSRYLETRVKSASVTGVAKYMAKQAVSQKTTSAKAATGVEKYMRDRG
ncbi:MAG: hypothetical protein QX196_04580 [Methylococcaceae bacterium]